MNLNDALWTINLGSYFNPNFDEIKLLYPLKFRGEIVESRSKELAVRILPNFMRKNIEWTRDNFKGAIPSGVIDDWSLTEQEIQEYDTIALVSGFLGEEVEQIYINHTKDRKQTMQIVLEGYNVELEP